MINIQKLIEYYKPNDFSAEAKKADEVFNRYKKENVFHSNTLNEMLSDRFEYKGRRPNRILVKNLENNNPVGVKVEIEKRRIIDSPHLDQEVVTLTSNSGKIIGRKTYTIEKLHDGSYKMGPGQMDNYKHSYGGVGFRLDQIQIERALQLGITEIPRCALSKATLYHTKMGFLPTEKLVRVKNRKTLEKIKEEKIKLPESEPAFESFTPMIIEKDGKFYLDINKTQALINMEKCKQIINKTHEHRILDLTINPATLVLKGEELQHWKEILKDHQILPKLSLKLPEY